MFIAFHASPGGKLVLAAIALSLIAAGIGLLLMG